MEDIFQKQFDKSWGFLFKHLSVYPLSNLFEDWIVRGIRPEKKCVFNAFQVPLSEIKVVITGYNPYITDMNNGLAYGITNPSVNKRRAFALNVIQGEIKSNEVPLSDDPDKTSMEYLAKQGVLLLNLSLTSEVRDGIGHPTQWRNFMRETVSMISRHTPCIWMIWGQYSMWIKNHIKDRPHIEVKHDIEQVKEIPMNSEFNYILEAEHPSSRIKFQGCKHFYKANEILKRTKSCFIKW